MRQMILTPTATEGTIKDNSVLRMIENSLSDGALYRYWDPREGRGDVEAMLSVLKAFWSAVPEVFPDAWSLPPRKSRLVHGVGIVSMGLVMDAISDRFRSEGPPTTQDFIDDLLPLAPSCSWCSGYWDFGVDSSENRVLRRWNELQNTSKDVQLLANHLLSIYKERVWSKKVVNR